MDVTFVLGELILHAVTLGALSLFIGLGGSATNDLGLGCLQALGVRFFDADSNELERPFKARDLARIARLGTKDFEEAFGDLKLTAVCDVTNPLLGPTGATSVFGPQKGIRSDETPEFERAMRHAADCLNAHFGFDCRNRPGAGAAGGMGAGLMWFFNAAMVSGADAVLDLIGFDKALTGADFVITGEGSFDAQSIKGKAPFGVLKRAKRSSVQVYLFAGRIECEKSALSAMGFRLLSSAALASATERTAAAASKERYPEKKKQTAKKSFPMKRLITVNKNYISVNINSDSLRKDYEKEICS